MREILFRAKDKNDGNWYEGYYLQLHDTTYCCMPSDNVDEENEHHYIVFEQMTDWGLPNKHLRADVDPETVCQYTGFNDIRGNKVFEHSIVFYEDSGVYGEVVFRDGKYEIKWQSGHDDLRVDVCFWFTQRKVYVVGNVFDDLGVLE